MRSGLPQEEVGDAVWVVRDRDTAETIVVSLVGSLVVLRCKMFELAAVRDQAALFRKLLELNVSDMVHGAYGIADGNVVLGCTLRLETLDYEEFQGAIADFSLALTNHYELLKRFRTSA